MTPGGWIGAGDGSDAGLGIDSVSSGSLAKANHPVSPTRRINDWWLRRPAFIQLRMVSAVSGPYRWSSAPKTSYIVLKESFIAIRRALWFPSDEAQAAAWPSAAYFGESRFWD